VFNKEGAENIFPSVRKHKSHLVRKTAIYRNTPIHKSTGETKKNLTDP
jgi:hypothetical protein